jgi:hypothetical protein
MTFIFLKQVNFSQKYTCIEYILFLKYPAGAKFLYTSGL